MSNQQSRAEQIAYDVLGAPPAQRKTMVDRACQGDNNLRQAVLSLVNKCLKAGSFLDRPAAVPDEVLATLGGDRHAMPSIKGFHILRTIGQGGMGIVYVAQQQRPFRLVAIKMLRTGAISPSLQQRFRREADILARVEHQNIARVYDVGIVRTSLGDTPYYVMEYIEGTPLTEYATLQDLSIPQKVALVEIIARAVHHIHRHRIVHRDLKPANILVASDGQPKILDFGIARVSSPERTLHKHTQPGQIIGTLAYMSPEQASGISSKIDARTDVYALGVILYELLAGRLPFDPDKLALPAALTTITEREPAALSRLNRACAGDPEHIVAKAMAKEPDRRYASALELANDIARYLSHEPVHATPPTLVYRVGKFARRNKVLVAGVGTSVLALVLGLMFTMLQGRQLKQEITLESGRIVAHELEGHQARYTAQQAAHQELISAYMALEQALHLGMIGIDGRTPFGQPVRKDKLDSVERQMLDAYEFVIRTEGNNPFDGTVRIGAVAELAKLFEIRHAIDPTQQYDKKAAAFWSELLSYDMQGLSPSGVHSKISNACETLVHFDRYEIAEILLRKALDYLRTGNSPRLVALMAERLAQVYDRWFLLTDESTKYAAANELWIILLSESPGRTVFLNLNQTCRSLIRANKMPQAVDRLERAIEMTSQKYPEEQPQLITTLIDAYRTWHRLEPDHQYDVQASRWQAKLSELGADTSRGIEEPKLIPPPIFFAPGGG